MHRYWFKEGRATQIASDDAVIEPAGAFRVWGGGEISGWCVGAGMGWGVKSRLVGMSLLMLLKAHRF